MYFVGTGANNSNVTANKTKLSYEEQGGNDKVAVPPLGSGLDCSTSTCGIIDKHNDYNADIKVRLIEHEEVGGLDVVVDGHREREDGTKQGDVTYRSDEPRSILVPGVTKERLAAKPIKYVLNGTQRYLSIGYDLAAGHLTIKLEGVDAVKLPPPIKSL